jgi:hypothetical protein
MLTLRRSTLLRSGRELQETYSFCNQDLSLESSADAAVLGFALYG